ncbi:MAG TPA: hypothetical protein VHG71_11865 [Verrucomicrobiae bacterium]|nr:hypothetical protein [Verrucomicrobiae bacterium]
MTSLLLGCERQPSAPVAVQGLYALNPNARAYAGCTIRLGDGVFAYVWFTDALSDPKLKENPQCGHFILSGSDVALTFSDGHTSHLLLAKGAAGYMLWQPDEYKQYLSTHQIPYSVLYQQKH